MVEIDKCLSCGKPIYKNTKYGYCKKCLRHLLFKKDYKGTKIKDIRGYKFIKMPYHPYKAKRDYVPFHRIVYEKYLNNKNKLNWFEKENTININGRVYLRKGTIIHHIDLNQENNKIENLELLPNNIIHKFLHNQIYFNILNNGQNKNSYIENEEISFINKLYEEIIFINKLCRGLIKWLTSGEI